MRESEYVLAVDAGTSRVSAALAYVTPSNNVETMPCALGRDGVSIAGSSRFVVKESVASLA